MHVVFIIVSVVLALEMTGTGIPKLLQLSSVRQSADHLGVAIGLHRMIGVAEIAAAIGLLAGIVFHPLSVVTGIAVCLLMCGAIGYHVKAGDKVAVMLPALLTTVIAVVVVVLGVTLTVDHSADREVIDKILARYALDYRITET